METNNINIAEILKDCPKGTKLYSPAFGEVEFIGIDPVMKEIVCNACSNGYQRTFLSDGAYSDGGECMLFPSKDQRDWSKFKKPVLPPFEIKRCEGGGVYFVVSKSCKVDHFNEDKYTIDEELYNAGNYFNTFEQAEYAAEKVRELLLSLRKEAANE